MKEARKVIADLEAVTAETYDDTHMEKVEVLITATSGHADGSRFGHKNVKGIVH